MRIDQANAAGTAAAQLAKTLQSEAAAPAASKNEPDSQAASQSDRVQLSVLSDRLLKLLSADSPERASRLERLAADFRAGRYQVDALAVSRRIVDEALKGQ